MGCPSMQRTWDLCFLLSLPKVFCSPVDEAGPHVGAGRGLRALDSLGAGNILKSADSFEGDLLLRQLDSLGQGNILRQLDSLGGGNILRDSNGAAEAMRNVLYA